MFHARSCFNCLKLIFHVQTATILLCGGSDLQPDQWRASDPLVTWVLVMPIYAMLFLNFDTLQVSGRCILRIHDPRRERGLENRRGNAFRSYNGQLHHAP